MKNCIDIQETNPCDISELNLLDLIEANFKVIVFNRLSL